MYSLPRIRAIAILGTRAKHPLHADVMPTARVRVPGAERRPGVLATHLSPSWKTAHYPIPPPGYATIAHARCGGLGYQRVWCQTLLWFNRIDQPMMYRPGHCAPRNPPRRWLLHIYSRDISAGSHHNHKPGCRSKGATFQEYCPCVRW